MQFPLGGVATAISARNYHDFADTIDEEGFRNGAEWYKDYVFSIALGGFSSIRFQDFKKDVKIGSVL